MRSARDPRPGKGRARDQDCFPASFPASTISPGFRPGGWLRREDCSIADFRAAVETVTTEIAEYPDAAAVEQGVLLYDSELAFKVQDPQTRCWTGNGPQAWSPAIISPSPVRTTGSGVPWTNWPWHTPRCSSTITPTTSSRWPPGRGWGRTIR